MATSFWLSIGYNFGCMIASYTLFDSRGGFLGSSCPCGIPLTVKHILVECADVPLRNYSLTHSSYPMKTCRFRGSKGHYGSNCFWLSIYGLHIDATRLIRLTAIRPYVKFLWPLFTRRRSWSFAEYWKQFMAHLNDVHVSGYNSAGSERICMKFGALREYCLELSLTEFGRDPRRSKSRSTCKILFLFCQVSNVRFHRLPVGQISRNLYTMCFRIRMNPFGTNFWQFACKGSFFPKTSDGTWSSLTTSDFRPCNFSEMNTNRRKSWQVGTPVECWLSIFTIGINAMSFPWTAGWSREEHPLAKKTLFYDVHTRRLHGMLHNAERCK